MGVVFGRRVLRDEHRGIGSNNLAAHEAMCCTICHRPVPLQSLALLLREQPSILGAKNSEKHKQQLVGRVSWCLLCVVDQHSKEQAMWVILPIVASLFAHHKITLRSTKNAMAPGGRLYEKKKNQKQNKRRAALGGKGAKDIQRRNEELSQPKKEGEVKEESGSEGSSDEEVEGAEKKKGPVVASQAELKKAAGRAVPGELPPSDDEDEDKEVRR